MPLVSEFFGIKIYMYWNEHLPPHFHAEYSECRAVVDIANATIINGFLPSRQLKIVLAWCAIHEDDLLQNWENAKQHNEIRRIEPLK